MGAEKTFTFQPGKIGAYLDSDGVVKAIDCQANILGVECGMRFTKLDGNPITAKDLIAAARGNVPYQVSVIITPEQEAAEMRKREGESRKGRVATCFQCWRNFSASSAEMRKSEGEVRQRGSVVARECTRAGGRDPSLCLTM